MTGWWPGRACRGGPHRSNQQHRAPLRCLAPTIEITAADEMAIDIIDNGRGIPADNQRRSGLANMARRAEQLGGTCQLRISAANHDPPRWVVFTVSSLRPCAIDQ